MPGDGIFTPFLSGEADLAVAADIIEAGVMSLTQTTTSLVIDLADVSFIDSTAIGSLVEIRNVRIDQETKLTLSNVAARVEKVLNLVGLSGVFELS